MTPEGRVKAKVKRRFTEAFKNSYRFMPVQNGMGAPGLDFFYCIAGLFVAIETKAPGKNLTERQQITASAIIGAGGLVFRVCDDDSLERAISTISHVLLTRRCQKELQHGR